MRGSNFDHGPPFIPFYIGDYLRDTQHLDTEQHGAYLLLLFACWAMAKLPDDDGKLMAISRCKRLAKWRNLRKTLEPFFDISDGFWHQKRIANELKKSRKFHKERSESGQKGASTRWQHKVKTDNGSANGSANGKTMARARVPQPQPYFLKTKTLSSNPPPARARATPKEGEESLRNVLADIEVKPPSFAPVKRSSRSMQPSKAKSHLMQKVARWLPQGSVGEFWTAMMGPDAQETLDRAVAAMRASGWVDEG